MSIKYTTNNGRQWEFAEICYADTSCNRPLMRNGPEKTLIGETDQNNS